MCLETLFVRSVDHIVLNIVGIAFNVIYTHTYGYICAHIYI